VSFSVVYVAGGDLDRLPPNLFSSKRFPLVKGFERQVPPLVGDHDLILYSPPAEADLIGITFAATGYKQGDAWSVIVEGRTVLETIPTKELGDRRRLPGIVTIPAGGQILFRFHNGSGTSKVVWVDFDLMLD